MITDDQRQQRQKHLGSSDTAAVHHLSDWRWERDVWFEKTYRLKQTTSEQIMLGNFLEPSLIAWAGHELGLDLQSDVMEVSGEEPLLCANYDGIAIGRRVACEAKTRGILWPTKILRDQWGRDGSDQVPPDVWVQCQHQAYVGELDEVYVVALVATVGLRLYRVPRAPDNVMGDLRDGDAAWWEEYVAAGRQPDGKVRLDTVKSVVREPNKTTDLPAGKIETYCALKAERKRWEGLEEDAKADLIAMLGDAEAGKSSDGKVTYYEQRRRAYAVKESVHPVLRIVNQI